MTKSEKQSVVEKATKCKTEKQSTQGHGKCVQKEWKQVTNYGMNKLS